jgi:regulatory protein
MPTITAIEPQTNRRRVNIHLDGQFAFGLNRTVAARLMTGQELNGEMVDQLQLEDARERAYQQALLLLSYRSRSEMEIRQNLQKHDYPDQVISHVLARLREEGLANDDRFAQTWVENRGTFRPRSRRALMMELRRKGLDDNAIQIALRDVNEDALAYDAAIKRVRRFRTLDWMGFREKMSAHLSRRGFPYSVVMETVNRVWKEMHPEDHPIDDEGMT